MSSKEQYKDYTKKLKQEIRELQAELKTKDAEISGLLFSLKNKNSELINLKSKINKKWWQFWK
jgi:hypothetical protein